MRYRRLDYRYMVVHSRRSWDLADLWSSDRLRLLVQPRWRPDADLYETRETVEIIVALAGVDEDDFEVQVFEDAVVVEGMRRLPECGGTTVYHAAGIHRGPFSVEVPLPSPVDADRVEARYERGLLHISLAKSAGGA